MTKTAEGADYCWVMVWQNDDMRTQQRARCLLRESGLAITGRATGFFSITHVASGFCVGGYDLTEDKAREVFAKLVQITDWTLEHPKPSVRKLRAIGGIFKKGNLVGWK